MPGTIELPTPEIDAEIESKKVRERDYTVIVWDDPVNLMPYVTHVFQQVFGWGREKAQRHMLEVHEEGRSVVVRDSFEKAEYYVHALQKYSSPPRWNRPHETSRVRRGGHFLVPHP